MIPAYKVPAEVMMEVVYAISQVGPNADKEEIKRFTDTSDRRLTESLKLAKELGLVEGDESYSVKHTYREKINDVSRDDRDVILNRALIQYRPFRSFVNYYRKGYSLEDAARQTNVIHDVASDEKYIREYFERFGKQASLLETSDSELEFSVEAREIPVSSIESVEALRNALETEAEIRFYLEETLGSETVSRIDEDTEDDLVKAFSEHVEDPRDAITASGRALEDYLRDLGKKEGDTPEDYEDASGAGQLANELKSDSVIRETQKKRAMALSEIRNKGGAHGDDQQTGNRWRASPEVALSAAIETTLLISSIDEIVENGNQVL